MKKVKISVEQKHIDGGDPCMEDSCPIALAIKEQLEVNNVSVFGNDIISVGTCKFKAPESTKQFVERFDNNKNVKPFKFTMTKIEV